MSDAKKPRKQRKSKEPLQIQDLELNKETVADLTEAQAERVKGGIRAGDAGEGACTYRATNCTALADGC
jgi:hypothetical protein